MTRQITLRTALVALLVVFVLACAGLLFYLFAAGVAHGLGIDTQSSYNYAFFSGVGPFLVAVTGWLVAIVTFLRHRNCHVDGCWRLGKHQAAGGKYTVCRHHHPDHGREARITHSLVRAAHLDHERRLSR